MKITPITTLPEAERVRIRATIIRRSETIDTGCMMWQGAKNSRGYGVQNVHTATKTRQTGSHRAAWLAFEGDIPDGLQIDHLCRVRACVNTKHMRLVTWAENNARADRRFQKGRSGVKPGQPYRSCKKHGRAEGRIRDKGNGYEQWLCHICHREHSRKYYARKKAEREAAMTSQLSAALVSA